MDVIIDVKDYVQALTVTVLPNLDMLRCSSSLTLDMVINSSPIKISDGCIHCNNYNSIKLLLTITLHSLQLSVFKHLYHKPS